MRQERLAGRNAREPGKGTTTLLDEGSLVDFDGDKAIAEGPRRSEDNAILVLPVVHAKCGLSLSSKITVAALYTTVKLLSSIEPAALQASNVVQ